MCDLTERAKKHYSELPPHARVRKGGFYINELAKEIEQLQKDNKAKQEVIEGLLRDIKIMNDTLDDAFEENNDWDSALYDEQGVNWVHKKLAEIINSIGEDK